MWRQAGRGGHNRCGQAWLGVSQQVQGAGRQVDAGQDTGTGRCVQVSRHEHREVQAQGRGTWIQMGCKCEHKNKVKKKKPLTRLIVQAGRQGQPQQVWPGMVRCKSVGRGKHRKPGTGGWRHRQALPGTSMHGQDANRKIREKKRKK